MSKQQEAMRLALEVLEDWDSPVALPAMVALRAALAEPEYPLGRATTDVGVPVYVLKKAEPVQEPVWIQPDHLQKARQAPFLCRVEPTRRFADFVPLYTAPPQRKPLTEEEIKQIALDTPIGGTNFARAIERAHGIT